MTRFVSCAASSFRFRFRLLFHGFTEIAYPTTDVGTNTFDLLRAKHQHYDDEYDYEFFNTE